MGWANHARCLHCGVNLPLYRKITDGEFCSAAHRKAFQEDQSRLAIQRLMETQQMCNRVTDAVRADSLAPGTPSELIESPRCQPVDMAPAFVAADPLAYDFAGRPSIGAVERQTSIREMPFGASVH